MVNVFRFGFITFILITLLTLLCGCSQKNAEPISDSYATSDEFVDSANDDNSANSSESSEPSENNPIDDTQNTKEPADSTNNNTLALSGISICLDPGHGDFSTSYNEPIAPGASETKPAFVSGTHGAKLTEAELNLKISLKLKALLESQGAMVYMTRTESNAELSNAERAQYANNLGCDLAIRIHADGASDPDAQGISVLVPGSGVYIKDEALISASALAGEYVLESLIEETGAKSRGVAERTDLTGFNWSQIPVILVETGFMTNPYEDELLSTDEYQQKIALGITKGITYYFYTEAP